MSLEGYVLTPRLPQFITPVFGPEINRLDGISVSARPQGCQSFSFSRQISAGGYDGGVLWNATSRSTAPG